LLDNNDQLVAIDRGAFWDLPYLSFLSLSSNQVLISVNSQAFVGVPNLQTINYEDCQLLDSDTKQMLDNITSATTLRLLSQQQKEEKEEKATISSTSKGDRADDEDDDDNELLPLSGSSSVMKPMRLIAPTAAANTRQQLSAPVELGRGQLARGGPVGGGDGEDAPTNWMTKYVYSITCVVLIVVALKFAFKYTSTRHYLEARRRRRRVYQSSGSPASLSSLSSGSVAAGSEAASTHGNEDDSSDDSLELAAGSSANMDENDVKSHSDAGESFMMRELQPHNAITASSNGNTRQHGPQTDANSEPQHQHQSPEQPQTQQQQQPGEVIATDSCAAPVDCQGTESEMQQEFNMVEHHEPFTGCPDCYGQQYAATADNLIIGRLAAQLDEDGPTQPAAQSVADNIGPLGQDLVLDEPDGQRQQLFSQSQVCDSLASTNMDGPDGARESDDGRDETTVGAPQTDHANDAGHPRPALDAGQCAQSGHLAFPTSDNNSNQHHIELIRQGSAPIYNSFEARATPHRRWAGPEHTDCRLFHCDCIRCGEPDLVGVDGYI
jgi:hypothetical protein